MLFFLLITLLLLIAFLFILLTATYLSIWATDRFIKRSFLGIQIGIISTLQKYHILLHHTLTTGNCISFLQMLYNKVPHTGLKMKEIYSLIDRRVGSLRSKCWKGHGLIERAIRRDSLASSYLGVADNLWHSLAYRYITSFSASVFAWLSSLCLMLSSICACPCGQTPIYIQTPVTK